MKKTYIIPTFSVTYTASCLPIAASGPQIGVGTDSVEADDLDVKGTGDWDNIWEDAPGNE